MSFRQSFELTDMPIVTFYIGNNKFNFLLDTGSTNCIINENLVVNKKIPFEPIDNPHNIYGMEGNPVSAKSGYITLYYNEKNYKEEFLVNNLTQTFNIVKQTTGVTLHGILGSKFFNKYKYILDFKKMEFKR